VPSRFRCLSLKQREQLRWRFLELPEAVWQKVEPLVSSKPTIEATMEHIHEIDSVPLSKYDFQHLYANEMLNDVVSSLEDFLAVDIFSFINF
jgi:hypothetical protein